MRRALLLIAVGLGVMALLVVTGIVNIKIDIHPPGRAPAAAFWTTVPGEAELPPALALWVERAKAARPAVVNVSTRAKVAQTPLDQFFRRFFEGEQEQATPRTSLGTG